MKTAKFTGEQNANQKNAAIEGFVEGDSQVLILSLRAGADLDGLQGACSIVLFGERDWSPAVYDQVIGRLHRFGQTNSALAYILVSNDGSDPIIGEVLGLKKEQAAGIKDPFGVESEAAMGTKDHIKKLSERYVIERVT